MLRAGPVKPARDSVALTRPVLDPLAAENRQILTARFCDRGIYYDPRLVPLETTDQLVALIARADAEGRPFFLNLGRIARIEGRCPELLRFVEGDPRFELVKKLYGFEPQWTRVVYRYRGPG